jgi:DNA-binding HxlR family transcriptional regulator
MHEIETNNENQACNDDCPVKKTAGIIEGKWTTLVIRELIPGKQRFSDLQRALSGISPKVLTARLRHLEHWKLVKRTVYPTVPPTTEYELTELGRRMEGVIKAMAEFGAGLQKV